MLRNNFVEQEWQRVKAILFLDDRFTLVDIVATSGLGYQP